MFPSPRLRGFPSGPMGPLRGRGRPGPPPLGTEMGGGYLPPGGRPMFRPRGPAVIRGRGAAFPDRQYSEGGMDPEYADYYGSYGEHIGNEAEGAYGEEEGYGEMVSYPPPRPSAPLSLDRLKDLIPEGYELVPKRPKLEQPSIPPMARPTPRSVYSNRFGSGGSPMFGAGPQSSGGGFANRGGGGRGRPRGARGPGRFGASAKARAVARNSRTWADGSTKPIVVVRKRGSEESDTYVDGKWKEFFKETALVTAEKRDQRVKVKPNGRTSKSKSEQERDAMYLTKPWMTEELAEEIRLKYELHSKSRETDDPAAFDAFRAQRTKVRNLIREAMLAHEASGGK